MLGVEWSQEICGTRYIGLPSMICPFALWMIKVARAVENTAPSHRPLQPPYAHTPSCSRVLSSPTVTLPPGYGLIAPGSGLQCRMAIRRALWSASGTRIVRTAASTLRQYEIVIYPDFPLDTGFFSDLFRFFLGKQLIRFSAYKMLDFRNFIFHPCIVNLDAEHIYLKLKVSNFKSKEATAKPIQTLFRKP